MREELNADLLRRIAYLTKGQLMGEILFYIFLLSSIVYLMVGKVYKSIVCIKEFRKKNNTRPLRFASENDLMDILGLIPGAVTPLGILNDEERKVQVFLDREFLEGRKLIGVHPNENTATVWLKTEDLLDIIKEHGNPVQVLEL